MPRRPDHDRADPLGGIGPGETAGLAAEDLASVAPVARAAGADLVVRVLVQPGARRPAVVGRHGDELRLRVAAPPERGRANAEVVQVLAEALGVPSAAVAIARGPAGRHKELVVRAGARSDVVRRLAAALDGDARPG
ncbi:MAG: DUF167 domain-containing protein [Acidimicrobiales bacterium]